MMVSSFFSTIMIMQYSLLGCLLLLMVDRSDQSYSSSKQQNHPSLESIALSVKNSKAEKVVKELVNMIDENKMSHDEEVLTATMIRFVEQPRFKMDLSQDGHKMARKIRVPGKLIELLRSELPLEEKRNRLDQIIIRLMKDDRYDHPTLEIIDEDEQELSNDRIFDIKPEAEDGQLRIPRAKLSLLQPPDSVIHLHDHQHHHNEDQMVPQETTTREFSYYYNEDYSDDEYEEYDDYDYYNNEVDDDPAHENSVNFDKRIESIFTPPSLIQPVTKKPSKQLSTFVSKKPFQQKSRTGKQFPFQFPQPVLPFGLPQFPQRQPFPQPPRAPSFKKPTPSFVKKVEKPKVVPVKKSENLISSNKKEVNNFGFPSSFGKAGVDFPMYDVHKLPQSDFRCEGLVNGGLYADVGAQCQMYHMCVSQGVSGMVRHSFLCPNGTLFSQETLSCTIWHQVDCTAQGVKLLSDLVFAWDKERQFLDSGAKVSDPLRDLPWRYRDIEA